MDDHRQALIQSKSGRWLRYLLHAYWVLIIIGILESLLLETSLLPETLARWVELNEKADPEVWEWLVILPLLVLFIAGFVGLFRYERWGRNVFVASLVVFIPYFLIGPSVTSGLLGVLSYVGTLIDGALLGLLYFSPVAELFERETAETSPQTDEAMADQEGNPAP